MQHAQSATRIYAQGMRVRHLYYVPAMNKYPPTLPSTNSGKHRLMRQKTPHLPQKNSFKNLRAARVINLTQLYVRVHGMDDILSSCVMLTARYPVLLWKALTIRFIQEDL